MAVRAQYAGELKDEQGRPLAGASIAVYQVGTTTAITETIYDDATGSGTLSNPLTADAAGRFQFYLLQPKRVDLCVSKTGYTAFTLEDVDVGRTTMLTVLKAASETVNNSNTLQDDDELKFTAGANETWAFTLLLRHRSGTTPDLKIAWSLPSGASAGWRQAGGAATAPTFNSTAIVVDGAGAERQSEYIGWLKTGSTAGTFQLQWAQNTADASDTLIYGISYLIAHRLA